MSQLETLTFPPSSVLLEAAKNGTGANAFNGANTLPSASMTLKDPVAMHLLVETALGDSQGFDVLSYEELDALKKEDEMLLKRIDGLRRKLALESKVRDAAQSLKRLYSRPNSALSQSQSATMNPETQQRTERELEESTKKVNEISRELYFSEDRSRSVQMRLLRHTAGVLQTTYGNGHRPKMNDFGLPGGRPLSPDSLNMDDDELDRTYGDQDGVGDLDGFLDQLRRDSQPKGSRGDGKRREAQLAIGKQLEDLNDFVQEIIGQVNPNNAMARSTPPKISAEPQAVDNTIFEQLNFLNRGLDQIKSEQKTIRMSRQLRSTPGTPTTQLQNSRLQSELETSIQENLALQRQYDETEDMMAKMLEELNLKFVDALSAAPSSQNDTPTVPTPAAGPTAQIKYAQDRIAGITRIITSLSEAASRSRAGSASNDKTAQYEVVLEGLWQIMLAGEDDARQRKQAERAAISARKPANAEEDSDDEVSPDEDDGLPDQFSLSAFSTKVQFLVSKSSYLKEKQADLRRRMRQMRDMYAARDASTATSSQSTSTELARINDLYATAKEELADVEARFQQSDSRARTLQSDLDRAATNALDARTDLQNQLVAVEQRASTLEQAVASAQETRADAMARAAKTAKDLEALEGEVVRLKSELTICKAELDASYGSRQERAADAAKAVESEKLASMTALNAQLTTELETLRAEHSTARSAVSGASEKETALKSELAATLAEFEELTKASVEAEREREAMEMQVDKLRDSVEKLEGQLDEEKIGKMGAPPSTGDGVPAQTTSAVVLRNEFKKMMKDMRAENLKALRAEQDERRKLEAQIRVLKKEQGAAGKGILGRVMGT
ncbi:hypothetical protein BT63DRAFT_420170 [Microthyrium microscopicum]|uniref:Uncharacterized protein n=1 Tax=Microthyrium microscopicum TaxID=703497 RepID=A0A6A6UV06_9PEZI|nr:hypothetical protein BT63DRAFT_420170 [Microthyrium microscopicum]